MPKSFLITNRRYKNHRKVYTLEDEGDSGKENVIESRAEEAVLATNLLFHTCRAPVGLPQVASLAPVLDKCNIHHLSAIREENLGLPFLALSSLPTDAMCATDLHDLDSNLTDLVEKAWHEINGEESYACSECGKQYSTSSNLARHRQTHRSVNDKKARKCPHCEKVYVSMPAYSMHVRTHNQGCECPYCGKRFSRPWLLQGHIRTHTGEKPFKCPQCGKAFADKSNLRAHVQTHSTEKPYVCGRCGKAFALKSYLYKHEESSCMRGLRSQRHRTNVAITNIA